VGEDILRRCEKSRAEEFSRDVSVSVEEESLTSQGKIPSRIKSNGDT